MIPVCPFAGASRPDDATLNKPYDENKQQAQESKPKKESGEVATVSPKCPFGYDSTLKKPCDDQNKQQDGQESKPKQDSGESATVSPKCPFGYDGQESKPKQDSGESATVSPKCPFGYDGQKSKPKQDSGESATMSPKCPFGYDSQAFKLGPFSCMICQALLYESSRCVPCSHVFCKACLSRFKDCPLCGADIEKIEADMNLQNVVDRFIEGHARIKRSNNEQEDIVEKKTVIYEDASLERGAFLVQQAMRAFRANNIDSAKSRFTMCADDIREQLQRMGNTSELCSQLGAVLGMLGDCSRATGDAVSAVAYFEESVNFLLKVPKDDVEITHTLSVSLNKIGDLKYYAGDLQTARSHYFRALDVRRNAIKQQSVPSQVVDVAISLAKVADIDRNLGDEDTAVEGFQEGIKLLQSLELKPEEVSLEQRRQSVLEFLNSQLEKNET
ncbi:catalase chaperon NCA1-like [Solanum lycopersicum]|uniref:RING-type domain-containing protein n=1 Tax=Solanum lycopersicum TaxID=4081 RepID=A0A3Q7IKJ2_SOLLC|nr:catalase chaperon NCA1-like [Solanum lycopersicum]XP_025888903.1 catalase chaperon NCA1-like isoform X1 [Solanum lycopersicum]